MLNKILATSLIASTLLGSAMLADETTTAAFQSKTWEVGLEGVLLVDGVNGGSIGNGLGLGLRAGYRFADKWSAVLEILGTRSDVENQDNSNMMDYIAGVNYDFYPDKSFTPYVDLGLGYRTHSDFSSMDSAQVYPGVGFKWLVSDAIQLHLEGKGRWSLDDGEKGLVGTIGISYRFGERSRALVQQESTPPPVTTASTSAAATSSSTTTAAAAATAAVVPVIIPLDSDKDGVNDSMDKCPKTPVEYNVDEAGCPLSMTFSLNFESESSAVEDASLPSVRKFTTFLKENPLYTVKIIGHADSRGPTAFNQILSEKRALSVKNALIAEGIDADRISTSGKGESDPIADNNTAKGQALNRRIEVHLNY